MIDNLIITCGSSGRISGFDIMSKERVRKIEAGEVFLTSLGVSNDGRFIAAGNDIGDLFIVNYGKKSKTVQIKPHHKIIRSVAFNEDSTKVITGSDDSTMKLIDIACEKVVGSFEGHKEEISCVSPHPIDSRILFSSSFDKSVKCWDVRMKNCVGSVTTGSQLWTCKATVRHVIAGGDNGVLSIFSIE